MTLDNEWDPLENPKEATDIINNSFKRSLKNIIKSYTGSFDFISELIQNALDAVDKQFRENGKKYSPKIWIEINLRDNTLKVKDNGVGFTEEQIKLFIKPMISFKDEKRDRGNKGVGISYLAYGFNYLEFETKSKGLCFHGMIKGGRDWTENEMASRPLIKRMTPSTELKNLDSGTVFTIKLDGDNIRPKNLNWLGLNSATKWAKVLRIVSPLGGIYFEDEPITNYEINVIDRNGKRTKEHNIAKYLYPHEIFPNCQNLGEIITAQHELVSKGKDPKNLPSKYQRLKGIYEIWTYEKLLDKNSRFNPQLSEEELDLIKRHKINIYAFFSYSVRLFEYFNQEELNIKKGFQIVKGGFQIATKNMPQGGIQPIPLTQSIGYQKTSFIIIHFDDIEPDLGRKGFQPEISEIAGKLSAAAIYHIKKWNYLLERDSGAPLDLIQDTLKHDWIRQQETHEKNHPLEITNENFFIPINKISITSQPLTEQDVIVLFNQLIAGGVIRGLRILSTSQIQPYDGACRAVIEKPFPNHRYDKNKNPLGIEKIPTGKDFISNPKVLEYKYNFDALVDEFEKGEKDEKDIDIVVCWELGKKWSQKYDVTSLLIDENLHLRDFHGLTHLVLSQNFRREVFRAIVLKDLILYLNDPVASKTRQQQEFE